MLHRATASPIFRLWTCKEAYLKATGEGLTGLKRVEITDLSNPIVALAIDGIPASSWTLIQLMPDIGYAAALAIEGHEIPCIYYSLMQ